MGPAQFSCLVVNCLYDAFAPQAIIRTCPSIISIGRLSKIDTVAGVRIHDKESGLRIEAWSAEVGKSAFIWRDQTSIRRGVLCRIRNRTTIFIHAKRPIDRSKRGG